MRKLIFQGLPETLLFFLTLLLVINLKSPWFTAPERSSSQFIGRWYLQAALFFLLGFLPGLFAMLKRILRNGIGFNFSLLALPGLVLLYLVLLPFLLTVFELNFPGIRALGENLYPASLVASLWLGATICRSFERDAERVLTQLKAPYQL